MRTLPLSLSLLAVATASAAAQTHAAAPTHTAVHHHVEAEHAAACVTLPEVSAKVPAVPAGSSCIHVLYTIVSKPAAELENVSGFAGPDVAETLGLETTRISEDYIDIKTGTGALVEPGKYLSLHYTGYLTDGTKFDSSLDRGEPIDIRYGGHQVIPGWDTGFGGMHVGGKRRLFIPYQLAYGAQPHGPIPARSMLVFDVELVAESNTKPEPKPEPKPVATPPAGGAVDKNRTAPGASPNAKTAPPVGNVLPAATAPAIPADTKPAPPK